MGSTLVFEEIDGGEGPSTYRCTLCHGRPTKNYAEHRRSVKHTNRVKFYRNTMAHEEERLGSFVQVASTSHTNDEGVLRVDDRATDESPGDVNQDDALTDEADHGGYSEALMQILAGDCGPVLVAQSHTESQDDAGVIPNEMDMRAHFIRAAEKIQAFELEQAQLEQPDPSSSEATEAEEPPEVRRPQREAASLDPDWYPFKKQELMSLLKIGTTRSTLSQAQYERIRKLQNFSDQSNQVPEWKTIRAVRKRLAARFRLRIIEWTSPLNHTCYGLSVQDIVSRELSIPLVSDYLVFIPEYHDCERLDRLSQSRKWLAGYPRHLRVQMVESPNGHVYIYEPLQVKSDLVVVPAFFFQSNKTTYARCLPLQISLQSEEPKAKLSIPEEPDFFSDDLVTVVIDQSSIPYLSIQDSSGVFLKDLCGPCMYQGDEVLSIPLTIGIPNPWRHKAEGKIIRHVPLTLYSDDTSGNVSKQWNKHMSFYFTLSGLPPALTNQEYHTHFLATSNTASALELGDHIVAELNSLSEEGFTAYDESSHNDCLVMVVILCHVGDSPMHAEITNTTNPAVTLNPCRMCSLSVETKKEKQDRVYVSDFLDLPHVSPENKPKPRSWIKTKEQTHELWQLLKQPKKHAEFLRRSKTYGIRDSINAHFVKRFHEQHQNPQVSNAEVLQMFLAEEAEFGDRLFNPFLNLAGFDGHLDTPVESLHVVLLGVVKYLYRDTMDHLPQSIYPSILSRWKSFSTSGLNIPPIQPTTMVDHYNGLTGKSFRLVIQAAPFIFFEHISVEQRRLWSALGHLGSLLFQTWISDLTAYTKQLKTVTQIFLVHLVQMSAQWVNKPKVHMLTHTLQSIVRFGPLSLCATDKFEAFNGSTRSHSVHSNRQNPGRDIATSFNDTQFLRLMLSGATFWDPETHCRRRAGKKVVEMFANEKWVQRSFGYNSDWNAQHRVKCKSFPAGHSSPAVPEDLSQTYPSFSWTDQRKVQLTATQDVEALSFVYLPNHTNNGESLVGRVISIWEGFDDLSCKVLVQMNTCQLSGEDDFYGLRKISVTAEVLWFPVKDIHCVLNVQHDCHSSQCSHLSNAPRRDGRLPVQAPYRMNHLDTNQFILNSYSLYSSEVHRRVANLRFSDVTNSEWDRGIETGLANWSAYDHKKDTQLGQKHERAEQQKKAKERKQQEEDQIRAQAMRAREETAEVE